MLNCLVFTLRRNFSFGAALRYPRFRGATAAPIDRAKDRVAERDSNWNEHGPTGKSSGFTGKTDNTNWNEHGPTGESSGFTGKTNPLRYSRFRGATAAPIDRAKYRATERDSNWNEHGPTGKSNGFTGRTDNTKWNKHGPTGESNGFTGKTDYTNDFEIDPQRNQQKLRRWRRRQEFRRHLEADAGVDEAEENFRRQPPPDPRVTGDFLSSEVRRKRAIVTREIARRKYYNYPVEDNLLTWKAKEQIFQLRQADPERWTPDRVAESFPISVEGARRLFARKWPPPATGESEEEVIRRHDEDVVRRWKLIKKGKTEDGLVSDATLQMIRIGQVKFLPMFAAGRSNLEEQSSNDEKIPEFPSIITPDDGPFMKLYKNHLQYLEKTSPLPAAADAATSPSSESGGQALVNTKGDTVQERFRSFIFPENEPGRENTPIQFEQFRQQLKEALKRRNRPEDRKYVEWMERGGSKKGKNDTVQENSA